MLDAGGVAVAVAAVVGAGGDTTGAGFGGGNARGVDVKGGGRTPLASPLTLRLRGGSERGAPLSLFFPLVAAMTAACWLLASCSSIMCALSSSRAQKLPFPRSLPHFSSFLKARLEERLWRTELCGRFNRTQGKLGKWTYHPCGTIDEAIVRELVHDPVAYFVESRLVQDFDGAVD